MVELQEESQPFSKSEPILERQLNFLKFSRNFFFSNLKIYNGRKAAKNFWKQSFYAIRRKKKSSIGLFLSQAIGQYMDFSLSSHVFC